MQHLRINQLLFPVIHVLVGCYYVILYHVYHLALVGHQDGQLPLHLQTLMHTLKQSDKLYFFHLEDALQLIQDVRHSVLQLHRGRVQQLLLQHFLCQLWMVDDVGHFFIAHLPLL